MYHNRRPSGTTGVLLVLAILAALPLISPPAAALANPAAVYCTALGYNYSITTGPGGTMSGSCTLPDNRKVDEWQFLQGMVAPEYSYCAKQGYPLQVVNDSTTCRVFMTQSCAVCVLPDGSKTEVTKLMKLDFRGKLCSNGICCDPKTDTTCSFSTAPPPGRMLMYVAVLVIVIIAAIGVVLFLRRRKKQQKGT
jgi:putative hemolysin